MLVKCITTYTHLSSTVYELIARYRSEIATFFSPLHLTLPLRVFPLEFQEKVWTSKLESWATRQWRQFDDWLSRFDTIPACDGQTDVQPISMTCSVYWRTLKIVPTSRYFGTFREIDAVFRAEQQLSLCCKWRRHHRLHLGHVIIPKFTRDLQGHVKRWTVDVGCSFSVDLQGVARIKLIRRNYNNTIKYKTCKS